MKLPQSRNSYPTLLKDSRLLKLKNFSQYQKKGWRSFILSLPNDKIQIDVMGKIIADLKKQGCFSQIYGFSCY